jgi:N-acetylglucosaminyl-diphospho-decaprenol L-rhamnosyltransferase
MVGGGPLRVVITVDRSPDSQGSASRPRLTIIIVNYESWPDTLRLLHSLRDDRELRSGACEVVVVDNASRDRYPAGLEDLPTGCRLLLRPDNGGFAVGVNAGWRAARGPWLLVLNPDVEVPPGFLRRIFGRLDHYESRIVGPAGIVGFGLLNPDGSRQGSVGVFPTLGRSIREQFIPRSRRKYQPAWRVRAGRVDWVTGACMLVNSALMEEAGGMDEDFFLYHEEVAFSRVAQRRGWRVEFDPSVSVVHRHPLQNRAISPKMRVITRHSKLLYFRKHLPRWQFRTLAMIVRVEAAIRGRWASLRARVDEARAWAVIGEIARERRVDDSVRGRDVLALAESIASSVVRCPSSVVRGRSFIPGSQPPVPRRMDGPQRTRGGGRRTTDNGRRTRKDGSA